VALLGWLLAETRDGSVLGLAERLTSSIQTCWPFAVAVALRRSRRPGPGPARRAVPSGAICMRSPIQSKQLPTAHTRLGSADMANGRHTA